MPQPTKPNTASKVRQRRDMPGMVTQSTAVDKPASRLSANQPQPTRFCAVQAIKRSAGQAFATRSGAIHARCAFSAA